MSVTREHLLPRPTAVGKTMLDNGIVLLHEPDPDAPFVALRITSKVGAAAEPREEAGRLNLAGTLLETGTKSLSEEEIALRFESRGTGYDLDVSKDLLSVSVVSLAECFNDDIDLVLELLCEPSFPAEAFEREREMVRMAIMEKEDDPLSSTTRHFREALYGEHPYGISVLGTLETSDNLTRDKVAESIWTSLQPQKMVVSLVGGTDRERDLLASKFGAYTGGGEREIPQFPGNHPALNGGKTFTFERDRESACVIMGFPGPAVLDEDTIPFRVLDGVLGGAMDSRLFRLIREERGLAYQVGCSLICGRLCGHFGMYALTTPEHVDEVVDIGRNVFEDAAKNSIPDDELDRTIRYLLGTGLMSLESRAHRSAEYSVFEAMGLGYEETFRYPERIAKVVAKDVQRVAERYLRDPLVIITKPPES